MLILGPWPFTVFASEEQVAANAAFFNREDGRFLVAAYDEAGLFVANMERVRSTILSRLTA